MSSDEHCIDITVENSRSKWNQVLINWINKFLNTCIKDINPKVLLMVVEKLKFELHLDELNKEILTLDDVEAFFSTKYPLLDLKNLDQDGDQRKKLYIILSLLLYMILNSTNESTKVNCYNMLQTNEREIVAKVFEKLKCMEISVGNFEIVIKETNEETHNIIPKDKNTPIKQIDSKRKRTVRRLSSFQLKGAKLYSVQNLYTSKSFFEATKASDYFVAYKYDRTLEENPKAIQEIQYASVNYKDDGFEGCKEICPDTCSAPCSQDYGLDMDVQEDSGTRCQSNCRCTHCTSQGTSCGDPGQTMKYCDEVMPIRFPYKDSEISRMGRGLKCPLYCTLYCFIMLSIIVTILCSFYTVWGSLYFKDLESNGKAVCSTSKVTTVAKETELSTEKSGLEQEIDMSTEGAQIASGELEHQSLEASSITEPSDVRDSTTVDAKELSSNQPDNQITQHSKETPWPSSQESKTSSDIPKGLEGFDDKLLENIQDIWTQALWSTTTTEQTHSITNETFSHTTEAWTGISTNKEMEDPLSISEYNVKDRTTQSGTEETERPGNKKNTEGYGHAEDKEPNQKYGDHRLIGGGGVFIDDIHKKNNFRNDTDDIYYRLPKVYWYCNNKYCFKTQHGTKKNRFFSWATCTLLCMGPQIWPHPTGYMHYKKDIVGIDVLRVHHIVNGRPCKIFKELKDIYEERFESLKRFKSHESTDAYVFGDDYPEPHFNETYLLNAGNVDIHINPLPSEYLIAEPDESYILTIEKSDKHRTIQININSTSYVGAKHGVESLFQLFLQDDTINAVLIYSDLVLQDSPRYKYRGLMIDTGRNYIAIKDIKDIVQTMSMTKMNVLHWRISSDTSFPWKLDKMPALFAYGGYSEEKKYTTDEIEQIANYSRIFGIKLVIEVAAPGPVGRAWSWLPDAHCVKLEGSTQTTCDNVLCTRLPAVDSNLNKLESIYEEINSIVRKNYLDNIVDIVHLSNGMFSITDCYHLLNDRHGFIKKALERLKIVNGGYLPQTPIIWYTSDLLKEDNQEMWETFAVQLFDWDETLAKQDFSSFRLVFTGKWDLTYDIKHSKLKNYRPWQEMYSWTEWQDVKAYAIDGGEATLWTDLVNSNNIYSTIWPRAAAVAERLWSDPVIKSKVDARVYVRLNIFRWKLLARELDKEPDACKSVCLWGSLENSKEHGEECRLCVARKSRIKIPAPVWPEMCLFNPGHCAKELKYRTTGDINLEVAD